MTRIKIIVEGQTEESFLKNVLAPLLWPRAIFVTPILLGVPGHKGGNVTYSRVKRDILLHLRQDPTAYCSTMLDLYGLRGDFPGMPLPPDLTGHEKALRIEQAVYEDILKAVPDCSPGQRFRPYLQVHEFEGLLFSDPDAFADALGRRAVAHSFQIIRNEFTTPEDINDLPTSSPSKRVTGVYGAYKKVIDGTLAAQRVGIEVMRKHCPHFNDWVSVLETVLPLD